jgi:hypothetical protein
MIAPRRFTSIHVVTHLATRSALKVSLSNNW